MIKWCVLFISGMLISTSSQPDSVLENLQKEAVKENKMILIHFTGSDWCASCKAFQKETMDQEEVASIIRSGFVYYKSDYTMRTKMSDEQQQRHDYLMEQLNYEGIYPLVVVCDKDFRPLKSIQRTKSYKEFITNIQSYIPSK